MILLRKKLSQSSRFIDMISNLCQLYQKNKLKAIFDAKLTTSQSVVIIESFIRAQSMRYVDGRIIRLDHVMWK